MSAIASILVATDFSNDAARAADRGARLAHTHNAALKLLHVLEADLLSELRGLLSASDETQQRLLEHVRRMLEVESQRVEPAAGRPAQRAVRSGKVLEEVLAAADLADLLVLGARGQRLVHDPMLGTTAERLLRRSRRPMLVVHQAASAAYRKVLVPVDFSVHSIAALQFARQLAPDAQLLIFHAHVSPYEGRLRQAGVADEVLDRLRTEYREQALTNMQGFLDKAAIAPASAATLLEAGDAKFLIPATAAQYGVDLIVMGKHGRSAVEEFFVGGVTRHTLSRAACDVAVVPDRRRLADELVR